MKLNSRNRKITSLVKIMKVKHQASIRRNTLAKMRSLIHFRKLLIQSKQKKKSENMGVNPLHCSSTGVHTQSALDSPSNNESLADSTCFSSNDLIGNETYGYPSVDTLQQKRCHESSQKSKAIERYADENRNETIEDSEKIEFSRLPGDVSLTNSYYTSQSEVLEHSRHSSVETSSEPDFQTQIFTSYECDLFLSDDFYQAGIQSSARLYVRYETFISIGQF